MPRVVPLTLVVLFAVLAACTSIAAADPQAADDLANLPRPPGRRAGSCDGLR